MLVPPDCCIRLLRTYHLAVGGTWFACYHATRESTRTMRTIRRLRSMAVRRPWADDGQEKSRWLGAHARPAGISTTTGEAAGDGASCLADRANLKHPSDTAAAYHAARRGVPKPIPLRPSTTHNRQKPPTMARRKVGVSSVHD